MKYPEIFDVIIIGGGHAGTEAAAVCSRMGCKTLLLTQNIDTIGIMSCNPAIGGIGKGHLVKEIDALDGIMAKAADLAGIHFRTLNSRKGPAVRATRAQTDRLLYKKAIMQMLEAEENLTIFQATVDDLIIKNQIIEGVKTKQKIDFYAKSVVLSVGTFLAGKIHIGLNNYQGGRAGCFSSVSLSESLHKLPFHIERLKTGTPPRIDGRTIDFSKCKEQQGDSPRPVFSFLGNKEQHPNQVSCWITNTNEKTHDIIRAGLSQSPIYSGVIDSAGPRYCPSIEDKVMRFSERDSHQVFLEPESLSNNEYYPNGVSTSLSFETQLSYIRSMKGLENATIIRPGYAIEYDFFDPQYLKNSLETTIEGLFFAGQINGTTGYEEAAAQGLTAGLNASLRVQNKAPIVFKRSESYIGVMVDDLITKGTKEPYRMFTSRAEYRLLLREDNADQRLTEIGYKVGCVRENRFEIFQQKLENLVLNKQKLEKTIIQPYFITDGVNINISKEVFAAELLKRPEVSYSELEKLEMIDETIPTEIKKQLEIEIKYEGYLKRQILEIKKQQANENKAIPIEIDYKNIKSLSAELVEKLNKIKPETIAQAKRIPGITPVAISLILIHLKAY